MNILFDLYTPQMFVGGAGEYVRKIFYTIKEIINHTRQDIQITAMMDLSIGKYASADLRPEKLQEYGIDVVDLSKLSLKNIIKKNKIDRVFIGCAQYYGGRFDVENINVPCVCVIHDLNDEELDRNKIKEYVHLSSMFGYIRYRLSWLRDRKKRLGRIPPILIQAKKNDSFQIITVSEYSKFSLNYNYEYPSEKIAVLYSPARIIESRHEIDNQELRAFISSGNRYYLMLSANRPVKNGAKVFKAFERYLESQNMEAYLLTTGIKTKQSKHHVVLPYLSDSDLAYVMCNCYAFIFPSLFEGFGYPPIEAMGYGKPVFCSNTTSIPEICGEAPIYFSPIYETDIFRALIKLNTSNYQSYVQLSSAQYKKILDRQKKDLSTLINLIIK